MRDLYISQVDANADALAKRLHCGVESIAFCDAERLEDEEYICRMQRALAEFSPLSLHAPYYEFAPCAIDPLVRKVSMQRCRQMLKLCLRLGVRRMIVHSGFMPQVYYPEWFVPKSIAFWKEFVSELPDGFELMIENVLDTRPEHLVQLIDGIDDPKAKICLDLGHANAYSPVPAGEWIAVLGDRIGHVHLHNNYGDQDSHNGLDAGSLDMENVLLQLERHAPMADWCIESMDASGCVDYLEKKAYL